MSKPVSTCIILCAVIVFGALKLENATLKLMAEEDRRHNFRMHKILSERIDDLELKSSVQTKVFEDYLKLAYTIETNQNAHIQELHNFGVKAVELATKYVTEHK